LQEFLKALVVFGARRQNDDAIKTLRLPIEIALVVSPDQFDHFANDRGFDIVARSYVDVNVFAPRIARVGGPAAKGKGRRA
jgi:hypothetical protein